MKISDLRKIIDEFDDNDELDFSLHIETSRDKDLWECLRFLEYSTWYVGDTKETMRKCCDIKLSRTLINNHTILFKAFCPDINGTQEILIDSKWVRGEWKEYNSLDIYGDFKNEFIGGTVRQYLNIKDSNGNNIFQNDVVKIDLGLGSDIYFLLWWNHEKGMMTAVNLKYLEFNGLDYFNYNTETSYGRFLRMLDEYKNIEVIGNIDDDYELLSLYKDYD